MWQVDKQTINKFTSESRCHYYIWYNSVKAKAMPALLL